jgi:hypothetical protein
MEFLLKLKHWQLFILTWGIPILLNLMLVVDPTMIFQLFPVMMITFMFGLFGWIYAIGTVLHQKLPGNVNLNLTSFKIFLLIPVAYILIIISVLIFGSEISLEADSPWQTISWILIPVVLIVHFASMVLIFLSLRFGAKVFRSVELGRLARFSDYGAEFFLIWFSPIGIWILQPRLNKLVDNVGPIQE